jgi:DNA repair exonuclease SbcCD ATPase subunit
MVLWEHESSQTIKHRDVPRQAKNTLQIPDPPRSQPSLPSQSSVDLLEQTTLKNKKEKIEALKQEIDKGIRRLDELKAFLNTSKQRIVELERSLDRMQAAYPDGFPADLFLMKRFTLITALQTFVY